MKLPWITACVCKARLSGVWIDDRDVAAYVAGDPGRMIGFMSLDPTQDGCAFHVTGLDAIFAEFQGNGLNKPLPAFNTEHRDGADWKVFFVVAPDGLCYWFGERQSA